MVLPIGRTPGEGFLQYIISVVFKRTHARWCAQRIQRCPWHHMTNEGHHWVLECVEGQGRDTAVFFPSRDGMQGLMMLGKQDSTTDSLSPLPLSLFLRLCSCNQVLHHWIKFLAPYLFTKLLISVVNFHSACLGKGDSSLSLGVLSEAESYSREHQSPSHTGRLQHHRRWDCITLYHLQLQWAGRC